MLQQAAIYGVRMDTKLAWSGSSVISFIIVDDHKRTSAIAVFCSLHLQQQHVCVVRVNLNKYYCAQCSRSNLPQNQHQVCRKYLAGFKRVYVLSPMRYLQVKCTTGTWQTCFTACHHHYQSLGESWCGYTNKRITAKVVMQTAAAELHHTYPDSRTTRRP